MDGYIEKRNLLADLALEFDYETSKKIRRIVEAQKECDLSERDTGKEPLLETKTGYSHVSYADGHGEFQTNTFTDWVCPTCGWFVGELYSGHGRWHIQSETTYCARCGQKIDWSLPKDEEKRRYEERKAKEREEWERKHGHGLDNMNERKRRKYGALND